MLDAAIYFSEKNFKIFRMGSHTSEIYNKSSNKVFDYVNSKYQNDFNDIYLLSNCEFYFGSDSGINVLPILSKKPIYIINFSPTQIFNRTYEFIKTPFIFKRPKIKKTNKLLTLSEFMNTDCFFSTTSYDLEKCGINLQNNNNLEILNFAKESLNEMQGKTLSKEDEEIQIEFDNLYRKLFIKFKLFQKIISEKIKLESAHLF